MVFFLHAHNLRAHKIQEWRKEEEKENRKKTLRYNIKYKFTVLGASEGVEWDDECVNNDHFLSSILSHYICCYHGGINTHTEIAYTTKAVKSLQKKSKKCKTEGCLWWSFIEEESLDLSFLYVMITWHSLCTAEKNMCPPQKVIDISQYGLAFFSSFPFSHKKGFWCLHNSVESRQMTER